MIPECPSQIAVTDIDLDQVRRSYLRNAIESLPEGVCPGGVDVEFLAAETRSSQNYVQEVIDEMS